MKFDLGKTMKVDPCTCRQPPEWRKNRPPSRALFVSCHGRALLLDHIGADVAWEIEGVGVEHVFEGFADGVWVWSGRINATRDYFGEHDAELVGDATPATKEQWAAWVDGAESPWDETDADYYEVNEPCPVHMMSSDDMMPFDGGRDDG